MTKRQRWLVEGLLDRHGIDPDGWLTRPQKDRLNTLGIKTPGSFVRRHGGRVSGWLDSLSVAGASRLIDTLRESGH